MVKYTIPIIILLTVINIESLDLKSVGIHKHLDIDVICKCFDFFTHFIKNVLIIIFTFTHNFIRANTCS